MNQGPPEFFAAELISSPPRRTGVIVGCAGLLTQQQADSMLQMLKQRFPHVTFAICDSGATSIAFEWDEPDQETAA